MKNKKTPCMHAIAVGCIIMYCPRLWLSTTLKMSLKQMRAFRVACEKFKLATESVSQNVCLCVCSRFVSDSFIGKGVVVWAAFCDDILLLLV